VGRPKELQVTTTDVEGIVAEEDPVLRNLQITVAYGRLGQDFQRLVPGPDLSWATFGAWASEGVGGAIRHQATDGSFWLKVLRRHHGEHYPDVVAAAGQAFAEGNRSVFGHIGWGFARFHESLLDHSSDAFERMVADLPGPADVRDDVHLDFTPVPEVALAEGFTLYRQAGDEDDPVRRAQLIAAANLCLAYVEQVRLQAHVQDAWGAVLGEGRRSRWRLHLASRFVTELVLKLQVGREVFRPGRRLPGPGRWPGRALRSRYPRDLRRLGDPAFARFGPVLPRRWAKRAPHSNDWTSLRDRLRYIAALMRSRQQAPDLVTRLPFTEPQVRRIDAGEVPDELRGPGTA
jgi:hypothetical protein